MQPGLTKTVNAIASQWDDSLVHSMGLFVGPEGGKLSKVKVWPMLACLVHITNC